MGIDPFIEADLVEGSRPVVRQCDIFQVGGAWDLISFNHSLEHMADPVAVLAQAARLLAPGGRLFVRVPVVGGEAWRTYGADWVQFDAPRHLYLHSRHSLEVLAGLIGMKIVSTDDDSWAFQFWGSELIRSGIPITDARAPGADAATMSAYARRARALNHRHDGDQVAVVLEAA
jgi:SAM-dependent methyltransferase